MKKVYRYFIKLFMLIALSVPCQAAVGETLKYGMKIRFIGSNDPNSNSFFPDGVKIDYYANAENKSVWIVMDPKNETSTESVDVNKPILLKNVHDDSYLKAPNDTDLQAMEVDGIPQKPVYHWLIVKHSEAGNDQNNSTISLGSKIALQSYSNKKYVRWYWHSNKSSITLLPTLQQEEEVKKNYEKVPDTTWKMISRLKTITTQSQSGTYWIIQKVS